jgi:lipid-A-disaccharide synthase-like uncharacterized protein
MKALGYACLIIGGFILLVYFLNQESIETIFGSDAGFLAMLAAILLFIPGAILLYKSKNLTSY